MALHRDLAIDQGTTWTQGFLPKLNGVPFLDETWTLQAQIRSTIADTDILYEWNTTTGNAAVVDGVAVLTLTPADSAAWGWTFGVYDLKASQAGVTYLIATGNVKVTPGVTR